MRLLCPAGNRQNPVMLQSIICSRDFLQRCEVHPCCWCCPAVPAAMQTLRSILRNNGLASSPQKECVQLLVSGSISVAMHQFLTTSSLGEPVLQDSCASCRVWLVLQEHASCPDLSPILLNVWQELTGLSSSWAA